MSKKEEMQVGSLKPFAVSLHELARRHGVWEDKTIPIWYADQYARPIRFRSISLKPHFRHWLIDAGLAFLSRVRGKLGVAPGPHTSEEIEIVDGVLRLPPPSDNRVQNISEIKHVMSLFEDLIKEVCKAEVNGLEVVIEDLESLLTCLEYIRKSESKKVQQNAVRLFELVLSHPFFRCPHAKLSLLINGVDYLRNHYSEEQSELRRLSWKEEYNAHDGEKDYEETMKTAFSENVILKRVYEHERDEAGERRGGQYGGQDRKKMRKTTSTRNLILKGVHEYAQDESSEKRTQYDNSAAGVLLLMTNFSKHANDHRRKLGLTPWTYEERAVLLEHHFHGQINNCFTFFWLALIDTDWDQHRRPQQNL